MQRKIITKGNLLLKMWLKDNGLLQKDLADMLLTTYPMVNRWIGGYNCPRLQTAATIEKITQGYVPIGSWAQPQSNRGLHLIKKKKNEKKKSHEED